MSTVLISDKGQLLTSLERFVDNFKSFIPNDVQINSGEFINKGKQLLKKNELSMLINHILSLDELLFRESKQAISIFHILGSVCNSIDNLDETAKTANMINEYIYNHKAPNYSLKFRLFSALFGCFPETSHIRLIIWKSLVKLAEESNRPTVLLVHLVNLDQFLLKCGVDAKEGVELYHGALNLLEKLEEKYINERIQLYKKFLGFLEANFDTKLVASSSKHIKHIILYLLENLPAEFNYSALLDTKIIKEFAREESGLCDLLKVTVEGSVADYEKLRSQFDTIIQAHKLNREQLVDRIRLNSIFQSVKSNIGKSLKLNDIASSLNLPVEETEICLVKAIQNGHIDAKIDQIEETIYIKSLNNPSFKNDEWKTIGERLENYEKIYMSFLDVLARNKK